MIGFWIYTLEQTDNGYIVVFDRGAVERSLPIPLLCVAVRVGRALVDQFDEVIDQDTAALCEQYGMPLDPIGVVLTSKWKSTNS